MVLSADLVVSIAQGSPGIGKTTSILALARAILGDNYKEGVLELNASDERFVPAHSSRPGATPY